MEESLFVSLMFCGARRYALRLPTEVCFNDCWTNLIDVCGGCAVFVHCKYP